MRWEAQVGEFRALGGIAENVRIGEGTFGRGLFVVDPDREATVHAPENLLVPVGDVEIRDGRLALKDTSSLGAGERAFFDAFYRDFVWEGGLYDRLWQTQDEWSRLPAPIVDALRNMGGLLDPVAPFLPPSPEVCLNKLVTTRHLAYGGNTYLAPL